MALRVNLAAALKLGRFRSEADIGRGSYDSFRRDTNACHLLMRGVRLLVVSYLVFVVGGAFVL
jgi:hypothetical protein